jgi:hypothetical protein
MANAARRPTRIRIAGLTSAEAMLNTGSPLSSYQGMTAPPDQKLAQCGNYTGFSIVAAELDLR